MFKRLAGAVVLKSRNYVQELENWIATPISKDMAPLEQRYLVYNPNMFGVRQPGIDLNWEEVEKDRWAAPADWADPATAENRNPNLRSYGFSAEVEQETVVFTLGLKTM